MKKALRRFQSRVLSFRLPTAVLPCAGLLWLGLLCLGLVTACSDAPESDTTGNSVQEAGSLKDDALEETAERAESASETDSQESANAAPEEASGEITSVYTELSDPTCAISIGSEDEGPVESMLDCPGAGGYGLQAVDSDARMYLSMIDPDGQAHRLDLQQTVTGSFSSLGPRAEWRLQDGVPIAMIVRVNAYENFENPDKATSYLAVTKISKDGICVTAKISPSEHQNEQARGAADASHTQDCLATETY